MTGDLRAALAAVARTLPPETPVPVPAGELLALLGNDRPGEPGLKLEAGEDDSAPDPGRGWRERLWTCPAATRLGVREVAEAMNRPRSWVYRATSSRRAGRRLPATHLSGELSFSAEAVRRWIREQETAVIPRSVAERTKSRPRVRGRFAKQQNPEGLAERDGGG
jgi:hypothetical protein